MRRVAYLIVLAVLVTACSGTTTVATDPTQPPPAPTTTAPTPTSAPTTSEPPTSPCLEGATPFANGGIISAFGGASGDAAQISGIRAATYPGCERVVVDLLTVDGAPAGSVGLTGVEYNESVGVVRINLPKDVAMTAVTDLLLDGDLISRAFVVRTVGGNLAIDVHVVAEVGVALRAFEVDAPSRIVVDLRSDTEAQPARGAAIGDGIVVVEPAPGAVSDPLQISGYARTFEANVVARLHEDRDEDAIAEATTTATDWSEAWGEYTIVFETPPLRALELFVGADSPIDGSPVGVWIPIDLGST
jgi:hypothetical protein